MTFWIPKYIWAEKTKRSMGDIWEIKGKSNGSGHEKGHEQGHKKSHEFLNYRSSRHPVNTNPLVVLKE